MQELRSNVGWKNGATVAWLLVASLGPAVLLPRPARADAELLRGDANADGKVSISDVLTIRRYLFNGDALLLSCLDAGDIDDSGNVNLTDAISLVLDLFLEPADTWGTTRLAMPFPTPGPDPTPDDDLACAGYAPVEASTTEDEIRIGDVEGAPGSTISIPFYISNALDVEALQLIVDYDPSILTISTSNANGSGGAFDLDGTFYGQLAGEGFRGFMSLNAHPELGLFTIGAIGSLNEEGSEVPPGTDTLLFRARATVNENAAPGTVVSLRPTNGPDDAGIHPPFYLRNELTSKGEARFASYVPRTVPGLLAIVDDISFFLRGDSNDDKNVDLSDAVHVLGFLFLGTDAPRCQDAADADDDGVLNLTDAVVILEQLFTGSSKLAPPFPAAGLDPTADALRRCGG